MAQHLNLLDPRFAPPKLRLSADRLGLAVALLGLTMFGSAQALQWHARSAERQATSMAGEAAAQRSAIAALGGGGVVPAAPGAAASAPAAARAMPGQTEVLGLRELDDTQRRILNALEAGAAGSRQGPSPYLLALARQAHPRVWLTGFAISENGQDIELRGRMLEAAALPAYLRTLNDEPIFAGRPFAQLSLSTATRPEGGSGPEALDFTLRSRAGATTGPNGGRP